MRTTYWHAPAITRSLLFALIGFAASLGVDHPLAYAQTKFNISEARKSVVFIRRLTPGLAPSVGSGFLASKDGLIYTNRHVAKADSEEIKGSVIVVGVPSVKDPDALDFFRAEVVWGPDKEDELDFAVLRIARREGVRRRSLLCAFLRQGRIGQRCVGSRLSARQGRPAKPVVYQGEYFHLPGHAGWQGLLSNGRNDQSRQLRWAAVEHQGRSDRHCHVQERRRGEHQFRLIPQRDQGSGGTGPETSGENKPGARAPRCQGDPLSGRHRAQKENWLAAEGTTAREVKGTLAIDANGAPIGSSARSRCPRIFNLSSTVTWNS